MYINIDAYSINKDFVINWFNTTGGKDIKYTVSRMAAALNVPCICIAYWLYEETAWDPIALDSINKLTEFYGYTTVVGTPVGMPILSV